MGATTTTAAYDKRYSVTLILPFPREGKLFNSGVASVRFERVFITDIPTGGEEQKFPDHRQRRESGRRSFEFL